MNITGSKKIMQGESIPFMYGVSWPDPQCRGFICHPWPLNHVYGLLRGLWFLVRDRKFRTKDYYIVVLEARVRELEAMRYAYRDDETFRPN